MTFEKPSLDRKSSYENFNVLLDDVHATEENWESLLERLDERYRGMRYANGVWGINMLAIPYGLEPLAPPLWVANRMVVAYYKPILLGSDLDDDDDLSPPVKDPLKKKLDAFWPLSQGDLNKLFAAFPRAQSASVLLNGMFFINYAHEEDKNADDRTPRTFGGLQLSRVVSKVEPTCGLPLPMRNRVSSLRKKPGITRASMILGTEEDDEKSDNSQDIPNRFAVSKDRTSRRTFRRNKDRSTNGTDNASSATMTVSEVPSKIFSQKSEQRSSFRTSPRSFASDEDWLSNQAKVIVGLHCPGGDEVEIGWEAYLCIMKEDGISVLSSRIGLHLMRKDGQKHALTIPTHALLRALSSIMESPTVEDVRGIEVFAVNYDREANKMYTESTGKIGTVETYLDDVSADSPDSEGFCIGNDISLIIPEEGREDDFPIPCLYNDDHTKTLPFDFLRKACYELSAAELKTLKLVGCPTKIPQILPDIERLHIRPHGTPSPYKEAKSCSQPIHGVVQGYHYNRSSRDAGRVVPDLLWRPECYADTATVPDIKGYSGCPLLIESEDDGKHYVVGLQTFQITSDENSKNHGDMPVNCCSLYGFYPIPVELKEEYDVFSGRRL